MQRSELAVGAAMPDPPFELMLGGKPAGFDIELTQLIAARLGRTWRLVRYDGSDFNGIFAGLESALMTASLREPPSRRSGEGSPISAIPMSSRDNLWSWTLGAIPMCARSPILAGSRSAYSKATPVSRSPTDWSPREKRPG
jgi:hypothetical protein